MRSLTARRWREGGLALLLLAVLAAVVYGPNVLHSGFLSDAWSIRTLYKYAPEEGFWGGLSHLLGEPNLANRPLFAVYIALLNEAFGSHMHFWLGWLVLTNVLMCGSLYLLLRQLSFKPIDAGSISSLVLLFPAATSLRFWPATVQAPMAITFTLLGFSLALVAFSRHGRSRYTLHALSLLLFVASLLLYEVTLTLMLASVLLYRLQTGWREATIRWVTDCVALLMVIATVTRSTSANETQNLAGMWEHGKIIAKQAKDLFLTVVLPFASANWYIMLMVALVPIAALVTYRLAPAGDPIRPILARWIGCMAGGLVVIGLGYAIYVPGIAYYIPLGAGVANRVNAVPSIGFALIVYSGARLATSLAFGDRGRLRALATVFAVCLVALLATGWVRNVRSESDTYRAAFAEDERILDVISNALPQPPTKSTIWTFGQPVEMAPGIPIFGNTWDMTSSVQLQYDDPSLKSFVAFPETTFACTPRAVVAKGNLTYAESVGTPGNPYASPYRKTYFVNTTNGELRALNSRDDCLTARDDFPLAPPLPPPSG